MAVVTNTFRSDQAVGNREELSDVVNRITPEDTPIYSMIRKESCGNTFTEWETEELADPAANEQLEGDQYTYSAVDTPDRMGNYTQIFRKSFIISNTQQAIRNAGNVEKVKHNALKRGIEIRKDIEFVLVSNTASRNSNSGARARRLGALPTWLTSNVDVAAGTQTPAGYNSTTNVTTALARAASGTATTRRAFTKAIMDNVMQQCYVAGGNPKDLVFSTYLKSVFVSLINADNTAQFRMNTKSRSNRIIANADVYEGPYGMVRVHTNRVMVGTGEFGQASIAYFIDRKYLRFKWLRRIKRMRDITANADAKPYVILGEGTLCVKNEAALGMATGLYGTTSST